MTVGELLIALVSTLQQYPPELKDGVIDEESLGDWLVAHFSLSELEILRQFEDRHGSNEADSLVVGAFLLAGLPPPRRKER